MTRRSFLRGLVVALVAPRVIARAISEQPLRVTGRLQTCDGWTHPGRIYPRECWYKGDAFYQTGYIYAPYLPLYSTTDVKLDS
jgi:hypothetical protein